MSRRPRAPHASRTTHDGDSKPVAKVRGPADVAAMIPYLLGFQPKESLVVVALEGTPKRFGPVLRVDLVEDPEDLRLQAEQILRVVTANGVRLVLVAAFSDQAGRADPVVRLILDKLDLHGVAVEDAFRVGADRWWSYVCGNPRCCSPEGTALDSAASAVAAEAVLAGMSYAPDRESLRGLFAPAPDDECDEVAREVERLRHSDPSVRPQGAALRIPETVEALARQPSAATAADVAWLALAVRSVRGQDAAGALIQRATAATHLELWRRVMCRVADDLLPPPGCLAAFAAWLDGHGVVATHAVERVLEVAPQYPLAHQLNELLLNAVDPRSWSG